MKVYVINLAKNAGRLNEISKRLNALAVPYERIVAILGAALSKNDKRRKVNRLAWWCFKGYLPRDGEIGAALSHQLVYREMREKGLDYCCVLEDDTVMDERFPEQLGRIAEWIDPARPQVILLSNYTKESSLEWDIKLTCSDSSAEAYVITRTAANVLLNINNPVRVPSDLWSHWVKRGVIELYHAFPTVIIPAWRTDASYKSDVTPDNAIVADVRRMSLVRKISWKMCRFIGITLGRVFCW